MTSLYDDDESIEVRRQSEIARYGPEYYGLMRLWRQDILRDWLTPIAKAHKRLNYLDVGCGKAESLSIAASVGMTVRGCEVAEYLCARPEIDHIKGAHRLPYGDDGYAVVTCLDVLEHLLPDDVPAALSEIGRVANHAILLGISQKPGPFHICVRDDAWWLDRLAETIDAPAVIHNAKVPSIKQPYLWIEVRK